MSLQGTNIFWTQYLEHYFQIAEENGGIIVVAAGNYKIDACNSVPAFSDKVITVGAATWEHEVTSFSNWGTCVDIWSPGECICSAYSINDTAWVCWPGTSMASPLVAGVVANLLYVDPTLTREQVLTILKHNGHKITGDLCDDHYDCIMARYDCSTMPQTILEEVGTTTSDTTTDDNNNNNNNNNNVGVYNGSMLVDYGDCKYVVKVQIDKELKDNNHFGNYSVSQVSYTPTDVCATWSSRDGNPISWKFECDTNSNTARLFIFNNGQCLKENNQILMNQTFISGMMEENEWYIVHCFNQETQSPYQTDCSNTLRIWTPVVVDSDNHCQLTGEGLDIPTINGACKVGLNREYDINSESNNNKYIYSASSCAIDEYTGQLTYSTTSWKTMHDCLTKESNGELIETYPNNTCKWGDNEMTYGSAYTIEHCGEMAQGKIIVPTVQPTTKPKGNGGGGNGGGNGSNGSVSKHFNDYATVYSVIGGIIGAALLIGIIVFTVDWYRRRKNNNNSDFNKLSQRELELGDNASE